MIEPCLRSYIGPSLDSVNNHRVRVIWTEKRAIIYLNDILAALQFNKNDNPILLCVIVFAMLAIELIFVFFVAFIAFIFLTLIFLEPDKVRNLHALHLNLAYESFMLIWAAFIAARRVHYPRFVRDVVSRAD